MQTIKFVSRGSFALALYALSTAFAANPWEPGGSLELCIDATLKQRPGIVTGWQQSGGGQAPPYVISILDPGGTNAEAFCDPAKPVDFQFKNKVGLFRYSMYQRATLPESKARATAPEIFAGPVSLTSMELSVSLTGKPVYTYQMFLPSNHKAIVEIDAITGRLEKGHFN
jgi:hypothetical protein